jgi:hypothetical protein
MAICRGLSGEGPDGDFSEIQHHPRHAGVFSAPMQCDMAMRPLPCDQGTLGLSNDVRHDPPGALCPCSSYYNAPVQVTIRRCAELDQGLFDRQVDLSVFDKVDAVIHILLYTSMREPSC